jgi:hypothetical protein
MNSQLDPTAFHEAMIAGSKALKSVRDGQRMVLANWKIVGHAVQSARTQAMAVAGTNQPLGRRYTRAMGELLAQYKLDTIGKTTRSCLLNVMDHLEAIEEWRSKQENPDDFNHPTSIWQRYSRSGKAQDQKDKKKLDNSPAALIKELKSEIERLSARNEELEAGAPETIRGHHDAEVRGEEPTAYTTVVSDEIYAALTEYTDAFRALKVASNTVRGAHGRGKKALRDAEQRADRRYANAREALHAALGLEDGDAEPVEPTPAKPKSSKKPTVEKLQEEIRRLKKDAKAKAKKDLKESNELNRDCADTHSKNERLLRRIKRFEETPIPELHKEIRRLTKEWEFERNYRFKTSRLGGCLSKAIMSNDTRRAILKALASQPVPTPEQQDLACKLFNVWKDEADQAGREAKEYGYIHYDSASIIAQEREKAAKAWATTAANRSVQGD